jgi:hypothetical protein
MIDTLMDNVKESNIPDGLRIELLLYLERMLDAIPDIETEDCVLSLSYRPIKPEDLD